MPVPIDNEDDDLDDAECGSPIMAGTVRQGCIPDERRGDRIDRVLAGLVDGVSRSRLQAMIADGAFSLDGETIRDPAYRVKRAAAWLLTIPDPTAPIPVGQSMNLPIVYEDDHVIVVDKPAGMVVHPAAGHPDGTLVNGLIHHCGASLSGIGGVARPGIVHRLDRDTSGLMVVAKTDAAHTALTAQFADRTLSRTYWAVVRGVPAPAHGRIDAPIGRSRYDRKKMAVVSPPAGRSAVTHFRTIDRVEAGGGALLECRLETGRTHQIRVHMAHIGHPLIGDPAYGSPSRRRAAGRTTAPTATGRLSHLPAELRAAAAAFQRQALHACQLTFIHPATGAPATFFAPAPPDLQALIAGLEMTCPAPSEA